MHNLETVYLHEQLESCDNLEDLKHKILPTIDSSREQWSAKINGIIKDKSIKKGNFAQLCGVSRITVDKWCKGAIPKSREMFLTIGLVADYNSEQMNQLLQRYGGYPALYVKTLEDCVCIYVLDHYKEDLLEQYRKILGQIVGKLTSHHVEFTEEITTEEFQEKLSDVQDDEELRAFISDHITEFARAYHKLNAYLSAYIKANCEETQATVNHLADGQSWSASLRKCVSAIRQGKWFPTRNKIISLGLHLNMEKEQIDDILKKAYMEPLCAKNIFESIIIYILLDASMNNMLDSQQEDYNPDALCQYTRQVIEELEIPEVMEFLTEMPEADEWVS